MASDVINSVGAIVPSLTLSKGYKKWALDQPGTTSDGKHAKGSTATASEDAASTTAGTITLHNLWQGKMPTIINHNPTFDINKWVQKGVGPVNIDYLGTTWVTVVKFWYECEEDHSFVKMGDFPDVNK